MSSLEDKPSAEFFPEGSSELDTLQRRQVLMAGLRELTRKFVVLDVTLKDPKQAKAKAGKKTPHSEEFDRVHAYSCDLMSLGLLLMEFGDAVREGDGTRILRCWRYFLLLFKASDRTNYSIEAFTLLAQYEYLLSPRMAMQLKWSRKVNVHGRPGKNIAADLHMEHLNRECKSSLSGLGANITDHSVLRIGKCIGRMQSILHQYDQVNGVREVSGHHTRHSASADRDKILKQLQESKVFDYKPGRKHKNFPWFSTNLVEKLSRCELKEWMQDRMQKLIVYH
jgi:L1 cell adhesion molecule like protein